MRLLYRLLCVAAAICAAYGAGYWHASTACAANAEIERLNGELFTVRADLAIQTHARNDSDARAAQLQADAADTQEMIDDLASETQSREGRDACRLDDGDAVRLRAIK